MKIRKKEAFVEIWWLLNGEQYVEAQKKVNAYDRFLEIIKKGGAITDIKEFEA